MIEVENSVTASANLKHIRRNSEERTIPRFIATTKGFLISLCLSHLLVLALMLAFGNNNSPGISLIVVTLSGLTGIYLLYSFYLKKAFGRISLVVVFSAFLLRVLTGVIHYLAFMDPGYFQNPSSYSFFWDFEWMHVSMLQVLRIWEQWGFASKLPDSYWLGNKNAYITAYNAVLYYLSGPYVLNISPWNSLHQIYTGCIIGAIALRCGATQKQALVALIIAVFQPFGFISSIMQRDFVGQTWIALAVYLLLIVERKKILWFIALPVAGFLAYSVRQPYLLVIIFGFTLTYLIREKLNINFTHYIIIVLVILSLFFGLNKLIGNLALSRFESSDVLSFGRILQFPLRLIRAIMGPFPWFGIFDKSNGYQYMPAVYLQCVLNLSIMMNVIPLAWQDWKKKRLVDPAFIFGMLFVICGILATGTHADYVTIGMIFFLPVACRVGKLKWRQSLILSFYFFMTANIVYWVLGLKGSGILMKMTGY